MARTLILSLAAAFAVGCSSAASLAPTDPPRTSPPSPTPAQTEQSTPMIESGIVGTWHRKQTCAELRAAFEAAGLASTHVEWANELCAETQVPTEHSHFFTAAGAFGSHDQHGVKVDYGDFVLVGPGALDFPSHAAEFSYDSEIVVLFSIAGDVATLEVNVPADCTEACGDAYFWALSAFASGPWQRGDVPSG